MIYAVAFYPTLKLSNGQFSYLFFTKAITRNVLWSKIDLIVRQVSYFKFAARVIKPHFQATPGFFLESEYCQRNVRKIAYTSLVPPQLEYASTPWDPFLKKEISVLERVQRKAAHNITELILENLF